MDYIIHCSDGQIEQLAEIVGKEKNKRIRELEKENERLLKDIEMLEQATGYSIENCRKKEKDEEYVQTSHSIHDFIK